MIAFVCNRFIINNWHLIYFCYFFYANFARKVKRIDLVFRIFFISLSLSIVFFSRGELGSMKDVVFYICNKLSY